jgi:serine/threonine protein kinase
MAPELVQEEQLSTFESDVYALGCVAYEVCLQFDRMKMSAIDLSS